MRMELALAFAVSLIAASMIVSGIDAGYNNTAGNGVSLSEGGGNETPKSPLLLSSWPPNGSEAMEQQLSALWEGSFFNSSEMERRFLEIKFQPSAAEAEPSYVPGELIVKLKQGAEFGQASVHGAGPALHASGLIGHGEAANLEELNEKFGVLDAVRVFRQKPGAEPAFSVAGAGEGEAKPVPDLSGVYKLRLDPGADLQAVAEEYSKSPLVEYAEPNHIYRTMATPDDTSFSDQWAHTLMDSQSAWDIETGDPGIVIAIIDTGVDWDHPDLAGNIWNNTDEDCNESTDLDGNGYYGDCRGYDFVDDTGGQGCIDDDCDVEDNDPMDDMGHGTHCSGIAAAVTDNAAGVAGVCWGCKIMAVRAGFKHPSGGALRDDDIAQALEYAANNSADVISMSFGGPNASVVKDAVDYAYSKGVVLVAASGNINTDSESSAYPAAYGNVIAVSATTNSDSKSSYSNYGYWVDVSAPGGEPTYQPSSAVLSTMVDDTYASWAGTSMACPHVAGLAGLILSKNPSFTQSEVRKIITSATDPISTDKYMGSGRIDMLRALQIDAVPASSISSPHIEEVISGNADIFGTASGANFINYSLTHGSGLYPSSWSTIHDSSTPVTSNKLGTWDTTMVPDGIYTLRVVVYSVGGFSEYKVPVRVLNNGTTCVSCDDCSYKLTSYQGGNLVFLDGDISDGDRCISIQRDGVTFNCAGNTITGSGDGQGVLLEGANSSIRNCVVEGFQQGIFIYETEGANLTGNSMNNNGIGLWVGSEEYEEKNYDHYIDTSNTVDGREVNYYYHADDQVISLGSESGHLEVAHSSNVTITGNSVYGDGIKLRGVNGSLISGNSITNAQSGIYIGDYARYNNITGNTITKTNDNHFGLYFVYLALQRNNIDQTNTVNGEPFFSLLEVSGTPGSPSPLRPRSWTSPTSPTWAR